MISKNFHALDIHSDDDEKKIQPQSPKCITTQPSFVINSLIPRIPTKTTRTDIDDEDDRKSVDHYITTDEQFENIHRQNDETSEEEMLVLMNSKIYNDEQPNWAYYTTKPDVFASVLQADLPIVQPDDDDQHVSLKQTFLAHFHRRRKVPLANNFSSLNSSSLNALDCIHSFESSSILEVRQEQSSWNLIWKRTSKHVKRGTFRVRKSRIMTSFDDGQSTEVRFNYLSNQLISSLL